MTVVLNNFILAIQYRKEWKTITVISLILQTLLSMIPSSWVEMENIIKKISC